MYRPVPMFESREGDVQMQETIEEVVTRSPEETRRVGREVGRSAGGGALILLTGSIGAGKSVFARGVADALGVDYWRGSPSFTLVNEYPTRPRLFHADLYRLTSSEAAELGLEEYVRDDSVLLIEWADRAADWLGATGDATRVSIQILGPEERLLTLFRSQGR